MDRLVRERATLWLVMAQTSKLVLSSFCWLARLKPLSAVKNSSLSRNWLLFWNIKIPYFVGNNAKGRISKRVFQENKACQIFRKTNISYPLIRTRTGAYRGIRNVRFLKNLACFVFLKHPFSHSPFCLISDDFTRVQWKIRFGDSIRFIKGFFY